MRFWSRLFGTLSDNVRFKTSQAIDAQHTGAAIYGRALFLTGSPGLQIKISGKLEPGRIGLTRRSVRRIPDTASQRTLSALRKCRKDNRPDLMDSTFQDMTTS
jgi:hypothetical protein